MRVFRAFLLILSLAIFSLNSCIADELILGNEAKYQKEIMQTGYRLLNASGLEKRTTFYYNADKAAKVKVNARQKRIIVNKGALLLVEDNNELAALLAPAVANLIDIQSGFFRRFSMSFSPRKYEVKADKKAVDLMVKAGYDPVALIDLINKTAAQPCWYEYNVFHHKGTERTTYIYHYIYEKYPAYIASNQYFETRVYQNFLHTTKKQRKKIRLLQEELIKMKKSQTVEGETKK